LLKGDIQARYDAYQIAHQNGWLSADDIRGKEGMNPIPDGFR
jgi:phage portal protein BeeE